MITSAGPRPRRERSVSSPPRPAAREPLYLEVSPLLGRRFTGIARFVARRVEALTRHTPLRPICPLARPEVRRLGLRPDLLEGQELAVEPGTLTPADADVEQWTRRLLRRPKQGQDRRRERRAACVFTQLRPGIRRFRREIGIFYDFTPVLLPWAHVAGTRERFGDFFAA